MSLFDIQILKIVDHFLANISKMKIEFIFRNDKYSMQVFVSNM